MFSHRLAGLDDLSAIVGIYNSTIASREVTADLVQVSVADRTPWFHAHDPATRPIWVAEQDGNIAGWLSFTDFHPRAAYRHTAEISIYVDQIWRAKGCGRYLLMQALAAAPALQIHTLIGLIFGHNQRSLELFEKCGFLPWGRLPSVALLDDIERDLVIVGRRLAD